ncbi:sedoheptulokinase-like [Tachypleus tridentatus]|uniref:sedoheptulokinase-like n=1 Tax=Tachypleus tridentatus TaxID=6853 RepID=UPI003FD58A19
MAAGRNRVSNVLGVDIGTTTVKVCLLRDDTNAVVETSSRETKATVASELGPLGSEQDVHKICTALQFCLSQLSKEQLSRVRRIAVSGQMHGCVLWKQETAWRRNSYGRYEVADVSCLYTWQDGRCSPAFLASLPPPHSHLRLSTGHGCATLLWLARNKPDLLGRYDRAGTIQDLVVAMLCGLNVPKMTTQNASSWGYFDTVPGTWNTEKLKDAGLPFHFLPEVVSPGTLAGNTCSNWYGISQGTPVFAAVGDMQCSVVSTMMEEHDAVLNISTSAQLSFIMPEGFTPSISEPMSSIEYFPYFNGRYLAVAASLNGGNVFAAFVRMLQQWTHELGLGVPEQKIWEKILMTAQEEASESNLTIIPTIYGERHLPDQRASVTNIDPLCLTIGNVSRALCKGLVANIRSMMPPEKLHEAGIQRIVGSGTALSKNVVLQKEVEKQFDLPVIYGSGNDAAAGAALAVLKYSRN